MFCNRFKSYSLPTCRFLHAIALGNTAAMLDSAVSGARENGAKVETFDLYKMKFSGCVAVFHANVWTGNGQSSVQSRMT